MECPSCWSNFTYFSPKTSQHMIQITLIWMKRAFAELKLVSNSPKLIARKWEKGAHFAVHSPNWSPGLKNHRKMITLTSHEPKNISGHDLSFKGREISPNIGFCHYHFIKISLQINTILRTEFWFFTWLSTILHSISQCHNYFQAISSLSLLPCGQSRKANMAIFRCNSHSSAKTAPHQQP